MTTIIKSRTQTLVELLSHLVRFPTVTSDHATNRAAIDWVEEELHGLPLHIKRYQRNGVSNLVATTRRTKNPRLWLLAHIDIVPGPIHTYMPVVRNGRLYGRGVYDMKHAIAVYIALLKQLGRDLVNYDLGLMITSDEEVGGMNGAGWLFKELGYRSGAVYVPDSGAPWRMEMGAKGVLWWELTATGHAGHGSRPWESINAINEIMRFVDQVRTHFVTEPCGNPDHLHSTLSLSSITSHAHGNAFNRVPDVAVARIDIRNEPNTPPEEVASWIAEAERLVPSVTTKSHLAAPAYQVPANDPAIKLFRQITKEVTGHEPTAGIAHGSSDSYHIVPLGIPTVNASPLGGGFHIAEEWVDIKDLSRFYEVTRRFVDEYSHR